MIVALQLVLKVAERTFNLVAAFGWHLRAHLLKLLLDLVRHLLRTILGVDELATRLVGGGVILGILAHALHFVLGDTARAGDLDFLLLASGLLGGHDIQNAVGVQREFHFHLRHTARCGCNALQVEASQHAIVGSHLALALQHHDRHSVLIVLRSGEDLLLRSWDGGVALDELGHHAAERFHAE